MNNIKEVLDIAVQLERISTWTFNFTNVQTDSPCNLKVTGVGLASAEGEGNKQDEWFEALILMDNLQLFFYHENSVTQEGWYCFVNTFDELNDYDTSLFITDKAQETMEWLAYQK